MDQFTTLAELFLRQRVFLEVAVPTILLCMEPYKNIIHLPGLAIWDETRNQPWKYLPQLEERDLVFLHPTKWGLLRSDSKYNQENWTRVFCDQTL